MLRIGSSNISLDLGADFAWGLINVFLVRVQEGVVPLESYCGCLQATTVMFVVWKMVWFCFCVWPRFPFSVWSGCKSGDFYDR